LEETSNIAVQNSSYRLIKVRRYEHLENKTNEIYDSGGFIYIKGG